MNVQLVAGLPFSLSESRMLDIMLKPNYLKLMREPSLSNLSICCDWHRAP